MLFLYSTPYLPFHLILQPLENFIPAEQDWAAGTGPLLPSPSWFDPPSASSAAPAAVGLVLSQAAGERWAYSSSSPT